MARCKECGGSGRGRYESGAPMICVACYGTGKVPTRPEPAQPQEEPDELATRCECGRENFSDAEYCYKCERPNPAYKPEPCPSCAKLREEIDEYKSASLLVTQAGDPADIEPHHIEDEIRTLRTMTDTYRAALEGLVNRLDEVHADGNYMGVWSCAQNHQGKYEGPTYVAELGIARAA